MAMLFPRSFSGKVENVISDQDGRIVAATVISNSERIVLIGAYGPAGGPQQNRIKFLNDIQDILIDNQEPNIILAGDLNICLSALDSNYRFHQTRSSIKLFGLTDQFSLVDVFREQNPSGKQYTWRRVNPLKQSRIDYVFVSKAIYHSGVIRHSIDVGIHSDHSFVHIKISRGCNKRGPGLWRFNNMLLDDDEFVKKVKEEINAAKNFRGDYNCDIDKGVALEMLMGHIRVICIRRSKEIAANIRAEEMTLCKRIAELEKSLDMISDSELGEYQSAREALESIKYERAKSAIIATGAVWLEQGEKPTKYFLNRAKQIASEKNITVLNDGDNVASGNKAILQVCQNYFREVYKSTEISLHLARYFLNNTGIPKLSEEDQQRCEGEITFQECQEALSKMSLNKSPGISGFSAEFFRFFWGDIGEIVVSYINDARRKGEFFISHRRGVITLIPKKTGDQTRIESKRPICLLDIIYKIVAKVMANRLASVIDKLVSRTQTGFIRGRFIGENARLLHDVIEYCNVDGIQGLIMALDFKMAFDSIAHKFLFMTLDAFNFGNDFVAWIKLLYEGSLLTVINNGYTSDWFPCERGTFQGSPISGLLFALVVEILTISVKASSEIRGIKISGVEVKMSQFADDSTLFIADDRSATAAVDLLAQFEKASGLSLNISKTKVMWLGPMKNSNRTVCDITPSEKIKVLGIWYSATGNCAADNISPVQRNIEKVIDAWNHRALTIKGRITVAKSLLASQLVYIATCVDIPYKNLKQIDDKIMKFIWRGRPPKVAKNVLIQDIESGGLKAVSVHLLYKAQKIVWAKRLIYSKEVPYAKLLQARLGIVRIDDILRPDISIKSVKDFKIAEFYKDIIKMLQHHNLEGAKNILNEWLWHNDAIRIGSKSAFFPEMYKAGIKRIGDITHASGRFFSHRLISVKYPQISVSFLRYYSIVSAIPTKWKLSIASQLFSANYDEHQQIKFQMGRKACSIKEITSRLIYAHYLPDQTPSAQRRWVAAGFDIDSWGTMYKIPYACTTSTRLQSLQYRILHRYIPTRRYLHIRGLVTSSACEICSNTDDLVHFFLHCTDVKPIWEAIFHFLSAKFAGYTQGYDCTSVIFGVKDGPSAVNVLFLLVKQYIVSCKIGYKKSKPCISALNNIINAYIKTEKSNAQRNDRLSNFKDKWRKLLDGDGRIQL